MLRPRQHLRQELRAIRTALSRLQAERNRHQAARARHDMRDWQMKRRERTRQLIELGGLVAKAGIVELTDDDRATIYGALLWMAAKLTSEEGDHARALWKRKGRRAFETDQDIKSSGEQNVTNGQFMGEQRRNRASSTRKHPDRKSQMIDK